MGRSQSLFQLPWVWRILGLLLLASCAAPEPPAGVARWQGGHLTFEELEAEARRRLPQLAGGTQHQEVLANYRRVAEEIAARRQLESDAETVDRVGEAWQPLFATFEQQAIAEAYAADHLPRVQISEAELKALYEEQAEDLIRPERRSVLHIFKRNRPEVDALEALDELRRRVLAGERFEDLTQESDSETRLIGGQLGWVPRGRLPAPLEQVVFALGKGEVSQPFPVKDGGVLFFVQEVEHEERLALADVRRDLTERLVSEKRDAFVLELTASAVPDDTTILDGEQLAATLVQAKPGAVVLAAGDYQLTAADFQRWLAEQATVAGSPRDALEIYQGLARAVRLAAKAATEQFPSTPEQQQRLDDGLRLGREAFFGRKLLEDALHRRIDAEESTVRDFYQRYAERYQSPLALHLKMLIVTDLSDAQGTMRRLEDVQRHSKAGGAIDLESTAKELGGEVSDLGWVEFAALQALPAKVRVYLFEVTGTGLTIPFQLGESLRLLEVVERRDPAPLSFEQAQEAVRRDYLARHGQELFRRWLDETLTPLEFTFDETAVRARLWPGWDDED